MVEVNRIKNLFHIFVKNHCRLITNKVVEGMGGPQWKGDIVVMRKGEQPAYWRCTADRYSCSTVSNVHTASYL